MIEINLISDELRPKVRRELPAPELKKALWLLPAAVFILVAAHIYLVVLLVARNSAASSLEKKWKELEPQRKIFEDFQKTYASADSTLIEQLLKLRITWSERLNRISMDLPSGIWLTNISLANNALTIKGDAVSREAGEVSIVNKFLNNLKNDPLFFKDFASLELASVQTKAKGAQEIVEFVVTGSMK